MKKYIRFLNGVVSYLKDRQEPEEALAQARVTLRARIQHREENFLSLLKRGVFGYAGSPYLPLLERKKIGYQELARWVDGQGVEATLEQLRCEGVYYSVDEFKGKSEVRRDGLRFRLSEEAFDNPFLSAAYEVRSGATRSAGTRIRIDFDYLKQRSFYDAFLLNLHESLTAPIANWFPVFPGAPGINSSLRFSRIGNPPRRWFSQVEKSHLRVNWEKRWGTAYIFFVSRLMGIPLAGPEYVSLNHAETVARWAFETLQEHPTCVIYTFASSAVRVCMAAREAGLDIRGARFLVTGEPLTRQKKQEIEATGARAVPVYGISEAGVVAAGCGVPGRGSDDCHLFKDTVAVIPHQLRVPHFDAEVQTFLFTSLLYESPKLLLNVGMGDYGSTYGRSCDCELGRLGFDTHVSAISSYEKLTGEGVTFVDTDFLQIIEKELPRLFGGQSTDYQLVEEEDARGLNQFRLHISPQVGEVDENRVVNTFIRLLRASEASPESWSQSGSEMWAQARTIRVRRDYPISTKSSKILPFYLLKAEPVMRRYR